MHILNISSMYEKKYLDIKGFERQHEDDCLLKIQQCHKIMYSY